MSLSRRLPRALAALALLACFAVAAVALTRPLGHFGVTPGRQVVLPGYPEEESDVVAVAIMQPNTPLIQAFGGRLGLRFPEFMWAEGSSPQDTDAEATRSRAWAAYAARHLQGVETVRWRDKRLAWWPQSVKPTAVGGEWDLSACAVDDSIGEGCAKPVGPAAAALPLQDIGQGRWVPKPEAGDTDSSPALLDWVGGSVGLAYALARLDRDLNGTLIPDGMVVAATGVLSGAPYAQVKVDRVVGVEEKAQGAVLAGADMMFVPSGQKPVAAPLPIVEVVTVEDAVRWLCEHGSQADLCPSLVARHQEPARVSAAAYRARAIEERAAAGSPGRR